MEAVIALSLAAIPLGVLVSALRDRSLRRRSRFWLRFAAVVICIVTPWTVALVGAVGEPGFVVLSWIGLAWGVLLVGLAPPPLLLFRGSGPDPGPSDDDGPGPEDDRQPPHRPIGGIPLPDAEPPTTRVRGPHRPRPAANPRRSARERERPLRLWQLRPGRRRASTAPT